MDASTREAVRIRAKDRCEYCHLPHAATPFIPFHVEHIIAKQHLDVPDDSLEGLALSCDRCNLYKGINLSSIDPKTGEFVRLFHPRKDDWFGHFEFNTGRVVGKTATGRATVRLLNMNVAHRVDLRQEWLAEDGHL